MIERAGSEAPPGKQEPRSPVRESPTMLCVYVPLTQNPFTSHPSVIPTRATRAPRWLVLTVSTLLTVTSLQAAPAPAPAPGPLPGPETGAAKLTSRGAVSGFVLDART